MPRLTSTTSAICLVLAVLLAGLGTLTAWARTQVLDTDVWVETSRATIQAPEVQDAVGRWTVDQVFDRAHPESALRSVLPDRVDVLAGPLTSRLRTESYEAAIRAMGDPWVEERWVESNRAAHERLLRIIDGDDPILLETSQGLVLDLRPLLEGIAERIGMDAAIVDKIPSSVSQVRAKRSPEAERAIELLRLLDGWGGLVSLLSLPLLALGIWLSHDRRRAWMLTGAGLVGVAMLVAWAATALGPLVTEAIATSLTWQAAVLTTWETITAPLHDMAAALGAVGVLMAVLAWSTAPSGLPRRARDAARPVLVDRPPLAVAIAAVVGIMLVSGIDVLADRTLLLRALVVAACMVTAGVLTRIATREADTHPTT